MNNLKLYKKQDFFNINMKNIFRVFILLMPFILFSCFEFAGGANSSKRLLNLAIAAPGDVAKLHIGVFDGAIAPETMIYNQTVAAGSSIPLDLPIGNNRIILVWAEGFDGVANYFGSLGPIVIDENGDTPLPIRMVRFDNDIASFNFTRTLVNGLYEYSWNLIPGSLSYELEFNIGFHDHNNVIITTNTYSIGVAYRNSRIRVLTSVFNLTSQWNNL